MNELTIIKRGDAAYIDSRQVAEAIGKRHDHLLRDIGNYRDIMARGGLPKVGESDFFVESSYLNAQNKVQPCYLLTKMGCELVANKLTGEKGVLFTAAYVRRFNEMEAAERAELEKRSVTPQLKTFNKAVKNVLTAYANADATYEETFDFLRGAYKPFGIEVTPVAGKRHFTVTDIARYLSVYSENGLYHGHAISAIIEKLNIAPEHIRISPYGAVGITTRYDGTVVSAVEDWLVEHNFPHDIPHLNFEYHVYYDYDRYVQLGLFSYADLVGKPRLSLYDAEFDLDADADFDEEWDDEYWFLDEDDELCDEDGYYRV
jgi:Rha family phage regulatory protein